MEKIKLGEYVRSNGGVILKVTIINPEKLFIGTKGRGWNFEDIEEMTDFVNNQIVKHSPNIIDLIEVGDYVNGCIVDKDCRGLHIVDKDLNVFYLEYVDIKTILTKEMYKGNCYKLEE